MLPPRELERGELTRIIIGTVSREGPITNTKVIEVLIGKEKLPTTAASISTQLNRLAKAGRIERVSRGVYTGC